MKLVLKIVGGIVAVLVIAVVGGFAYLTTVDVNAYKPDIVAAVKEATGRDLVIDSPIGLDISFSPSLDLKAVSLSNPEWAGAEPMVQVADFSVKVELLPLISSEIVVDRLVLKDVVVDLQRNAEGLANWEFTPLAAVAAEEEAPVADEPASSEPAEVVIPTIRSVEIENVSLSFVDDVAGMSQNVVLKSLIVDGVTPGSPVDLSLDAIYQDIVISLSGTVGDLAAAASGDALPVDLVLTADDARIALNGVIEEPLEASGANLAISAGVPNWVALAEKALPGGLPMALPDLGALDLSANIAQSGPMGGAITDLAFSYGGLTVTGDVSGDGLTHTGAADLKVVSGDPMALAQAFGVDLPSLGALDLALVAKADEPMQVDVTSLVATLGDISVDLALQMDGSMLPMPDVSATLKAAIADPAALAGKFGTPMAPLGPLAVNLALEGEDARYALNDLVLTLGETDLSGSVSADMSGAVPKIIVDLDSKLIDVNPFLQGGGDASSSASSSTQGGVSGQAQPSGGRVIPNTPIPLEALKSLNAEISLDAGQVNLAPLTITELDLDTVLQDGVLDVRPLGMKLLDGDVTLSAKVDGSQTTPALNIDGSIVDIDIEEATKAIGGLDFGEFALSGGKVKFDTALDSRGQTVREMAAALNGNIDLQVDAAVLKGIDVEPLLKGNFLAAIGSTQEGAQTAISCLVTRFNVKDGVMTDNGIILDTSEAALSVNGQISLVDESLNLLLRPAPKDPQLLSIAPDIGITGTFASPSFAPTTESLLKGLAGIGLMAVNPAAGLVASLASTGSADENGCLAALERKPGESAAPASQNPIQGIINSIPGLAPSNANPNAEGGEPPAQPSNPAANILRGVLQGVTQQNNQQEENSEPANPAQQLFRGLLGN